MEGTKKKTGKIILIIGIILVALVLMFVIWGVASNNSAIHKEEQILESQSSITIQTGKRDRTIIELAQVVEKASQVEAEILNNIAEARKQGDMEGLTTNLNLVIERYPEVIKSIENYNTFMLEISQLENQVARYKETFNIQVKAYRQYVRSFPNSLFLSIGGYQVVDYSYYPEDSDNKLNFDPTNIFGD